MLNTFTDLQSTKEQALFLSKVQLTQRESARKTSVNSISAVLVEVLFFSLDSRIVSVSFLIYI